MTVLDASVVVAALVGTGEEGQWAESLLREQPLAAPHLMPAEVTSYLRRGVSSGSLDADIAAIALDDLADLPLSLHSFQPLAGRVWELRSAVTAYDGWYVALAEVLDQPLATLDERLAGAPGPWCEFRMPPS
jgi:predicted nucleic acid-binding protein